jgi:hypothetical protein
MGSLGDPPPSGTRRRTWSGGEIEQLYEGVVHNGRTMLRLEQVQGDSWAAFFSFARFPDLMSFPEGEPWLHYADSLPFPVEVSSRMRLIPPAKASKDVSRRLAHATSARRGRRRRLPSRSRSPPPGCLSTASRKTGCRSSTAGTG